MGFGDLKTDAGVKALNEFLQDRSYIEGYQPSQADAVVFSALSGAPKEDLFHALRWYRQISSYGSDKDSFPGTKKPVASYGGGAAPAAAADDDDDDDDDGDLFGSEEEDDEEIERIREEKAQKALAERAKTKKVVIAKSSVLFDIKGYDDETPWPEIEKSIKAIEIDGLTWGASKIMDHVYGVKKLQVLTTIVDDKVSVEELKDKIEEDYEDVQSVDIAAFNKI